MCVSQSHKTSAMAFLRGARTRQLAVKDTSNPGAAPALAVIGCKNAADVIAVLVIDRIAAKNRKQAAEMVATRRQSAGGARQPRRRANHEPRARRAPAAREVAGAPQSNNQSSSAGGPPTLAATVFLPSVIALAVACDDDFCVGHSTLSAFRVPSNLVTIKAFGGSWLARFKLYCMSPCPARCTRRTTARLHKTLRVRPERPRRVLVLYHNSRRRTTTVG